MSVLGERRTDPLSLDGRVMHASETAEGGVVNAETVFRFSQEGDLVTATYAGGGIRRGYLVGRMVRGRLQFRYAQLQDDGRLDGGESDCEVEVTSEGHVRLVEHFQWTSRPGGGTNVLSESRTVAPLAPRSPVTPPHRPRRMRQAYDRLAHEYTSRLFGELADKPGDRALLDRFASLVAGRGPVCDLGCGPGQVGAYLHGRGVRVLGLDLSHGMLRAGRGVRPDAAFVQADMMSLPFAEGALAGVVAFYSIIHVPRRSLSTLLSAVHAALQPGGALFVSFHVGDGPLVVDELWGIAVPPIEFLFLRPAEVKQAVAAAGFEAIEMIEREPYPDVEYQSRRAYLLATRAVALSP